ncbi:MULTISPECIES: hypothetical protein [Nocardiopsis]|uniref:Uncharacterized protein n=2 Tax=Nocardiopsis TaxID=2013 RepID=A0A840W8Q4_9ACTN|nr:MULTISPECIES: hypothetical protein [Nocardiopsis]MBB5493440.1 hypothetical protein [Nocardiopsis metallicus]MCK9873054.1 hypothetical protein [Nocardiopsis dassonvillei]MEE2052060.1 hypothetical protein [Nocardiopsis umidischolae]
MIALPHTGIRVPTTTVHVLAVHQTGQGCDALQIAPVHEGRTLLGYAVNTGGDTRFVAVDRRGAFMVWSFIEQTKIFTDPALSDADVLDHLIAEHDWSRAAREAHTKRCYLVRILNSDRLPQSAELVDLAVPYPDFEAAARVLRTQPLPEGAVRMELWTGTMWEVVHDRPTTREGG